MQSVDQWLEGDFLNVLFSILKHRKSEDPDPGFYNDEKVTESMRLLTTTISSKIEPQADSTDASEDKPQANLPKATENLLHSDLKDRMVKIPHGTFMMGDNATGQVEVRISKPFMMDKYPMTQSLYAKLMGHNPSRFRGEDLPVDSVTWYEAVEFCNKLSEEYSLNPVYNINGKHVEPIPDTNGYRLPTEAEWEYACRAGLQTSHYDDLETIAWHSKNSMDSSQSVGQKEPNAFGLYDMLGNVWEWCFDWYSPQYDDKVGLDPIGPETGKSKVLRGGSWLDFASSVQATSRIGGEPDIPSYNQCFRMILPLEQGTIRAELT